jgi:DNA repair protein RadC
MQIFETSLQFRLVRVGDIDPLTKPTAFLDYMTGAFVDCAHEESLWLISMNPKCRPISRTLLRTGPLVAAVTLPRDLFRVALLAEANAIAIVRGEPSENVAMTVHDTRALKRFGETAGWLNIRFVDYLILSTSDSLRKPLFYSWNATGRI